jgi:hypothetical protein
MAQPSKVVRPSLGWFALLDGGLAALAVLSSSAGAHQAVSEASPLPLPPQSRLRAMLAAAFVIHLVEARAAARAARRYGLPARGWALQTFVVGFPSLFALRRAGRA